jgi:hypothetical protein
MSQATSSKQVGRKGAAGGKEERDIAAATSAVADRPARRLSERPRLLLQDTSGGEGFRRPLGYWWGDSGACGLGILPAPAPGQSLRLPGASSTKHGAQRGHSSSTAPAARTSSCAPTPLLPPCHAQGHLQHLVAWSSRQAGIATIPGRACKVSCAAAVGPTSTLPPWRHANCPSCQLPDGTRRMAPKYGKRARSRVSRSCARTPSVSWAAAAACTGPAVVRNCAAHVSTLDAQAYVPRSKCACTFANTEPARCGMRRALCRAPHGRSVSGRCSSSLAELLETLLTLTTGKLRQRPHGRLRPGHRPG